ncbi:alpha/beta fold hydrolase [Streptomyces sp. MBT65]|nr:alpha/beta fold hydrolase [Streptomyces sp. MBT65]
MGSSVLKRACGARGEGVPGPFRAWWNVAPSDIVVKPRRRKDFAWDPAWVSHITAPTLPLWTDHDPTGGLDEAALLQGWLPDARLHVIEDAGHWPQWEKPAEFLRAHRDFLLLGKDPV